MHGYITSLDCLKSVRYDLFSLTLFCIYLVNAYVWYMFLFPSMAIKGYRSPLENKDLWSLNKDDSSEVVVPKLLKEWEVEKSKLQRYAEALDPPQTWALLKSDKKKGIIKIYYMKSWNNYFLALGQNNRKTLLTNLRTPSMQWSMVVVVLCCRDAFLQQGLGNCWGQDGCS